MELSPASVGDVVVGLARIGRFKHMKLSGTWKIFWRSLLMVLLLLLIDYVFKKLSSKLEVWW